MKWRFLLPAAAVAVLCGFFWYALEGGRYDPLLIDSPLLGRPAPQFAMANLADPAQRITLQQYLGKPFVLNVWGTWCGGCREEHPELLAIARQTEVPIIGIDWKDDHEAAKAWLGQLGNPYHVVGVDDDGSIAIDWGVYGAPETFLVGADGRVLTKNVGPMSVEIWRTKFLPLLEAKGAAR
jgi:cytochrome c biogenesis protein CcmG/thiol:disulfide interchange protein DsbE